MALEMYFKIIKNSNVSDFCLLLVTCLHFGYPPHVQLFVKIHKQSREKIQWNFSKMILTIWH